MAHFAQLDENNTVIAVTVGRDEDDGKELDLCARTGDIYRQTSYNTYGGVHYDPVTKEPSADQTKAFRKNYAGLGYVYDVALDAFIPPKPFASWSLNENFCVWQAPVPYPGDQKPYEWDENAQKWAPIPLEEPEK